MRVLLFNYEYPPLGGGAGVATRYLLSSLSRFDDVEVELVTSSLGENRLTHLSDRIRIHFLDIGKTGSLHYQSQRNLLTYATRSYFYAKRLLRARPFDLIHAFFGIPSGPVARRLGLPYIISLRGSDVPFYSDRFKTLDRVLFKRISRSVWQDAAFVVTNSEGLRDLAGRTAPDQPIEVIYNGVDTDFYSPEPRRRTGNGMTLVSTGRLIERKGYHLLIEALAGIEGVTLKLIGDGNRKDELSASASRHNVDVVFLGPQPRESVVEILRGADLFVLPSLNEGMSNALLEALAAGLPVVVTDVGGSRELVRGNGIIVEKGDVSGLRQAVLRYLEQPTLLDIHGEASRKRALDMSVDVMADQYRELYLRTTR